MQVSAPSACSAHLQSHTSDAGGAQVTTPCQPQYVANVCACVTSAPLRASRLIFTLIIAVAGSPSRKAPCVIHSTKLTHDVFVLVRTRAAEGQQYSSSVRSRTCRALCSRPSRPSSPDRVAGAVYYHSIAVVRLPAPTMPAADG